MESPTDSGSSISHAPTLRPALRWYHIFMIAIGGVVGLSFAIESGEILGIAGAGGALIAYAVNGLVAICVMEGLCEMIVHWPISNAMIEFVRAFVDRDLAIVVGIAYWYTYATTFVALLIGSPHLLKFWGISDGSLVAVTVGCIVGLILINCCHILLFGNIELVGGILKITVLFIMFVLMMCINTGDIGDHDIGSTFFNDGIRFNPEVASSKFVAILVVIPIVTISLVGVEVIAVTAFEAAKPSELQSPAKNIAWVTFVLYLTSIGGFIANVEWFNPNLPTLLSQPLVSNTLPSTVLGHTPVFNQTGLPVSAAPTIAAWQVNAPTIAGLLTGFLVYSGLSCANVGLYVASRTLYGLTRNIDNEDRRWVPIYSILFSVIIFSSWLPFVNFSTGFTQEELQGVFFSIAGSGGLLVWASQCLAFIRYYHWLHMHKNRLTGRYLAKFQRWPQKGFSSWGSSLQPGLAYFGLISCLIIVFVLNSASLWNRTQSLYKALTVYLGPLVLLIIFCILKAINRRWWVELDENREVLIGTLKGLDLLINPDRESAADIESTLTPNVRSIIGNGVVTTPSEGSPEASRFTQKEAAPRITGGLETHETEIITPH